MAAMSHPKIILLQARESDDPVIAEEQRIFARSARVPTENVIPHSLLRSVPSLGDVRKFDALMIGGSGEYFVSRENLPDFQGILAFLGELQQHTQQHDQECPQS